MQRRAAVLSTGAIRRTETARLMSETGWDPLETRRARSKMAYFLKIVKGLSPLYLNTRIIFKPPNYEFLEPSPVIVFKLLNLNVASLAIIDHFFPTARASGTL